MRTILRSLLLAGWFFVAGCQSQRSAPTQVGGAVREGEVGKEETVVEAMRSASGVLQHYPLDVKGMRAWLGHEFLVGLTPVKATDAVSRDTLLAMVGEYVEVEGRWNPGEEWQRPTPEDEEFYMQHPTGPEFEKIVLGACIEVTAIEQIEN